MLADSSNSGATLYVRLGAAAMRRPCATTQGPLLPRSVWRARIHSVLRIQMSPDFDNEQSALTLS